MYSFGVILWELLTRQLPSNLSQELNETTVFPQWIAPCLRDLIRSCCTTDRHQRPSFESILNDLNRLQMQFQSTPDQLLQNYDIPRVQQLISSRTAVSNLQALHQLGEWTRLRDETMICHQCHYQDNH